MFQVSSQDIAEQTSLLFDMSLSQLFGKENADLTIYYRTDIDSALESLQHWKDNIRVIPQLIQNDVSSTKIRLSLRRAMSVQYLIPAPVIEYIEQHGLYQEDGASSIHEKEESKGTESSGRASPATSTR
jgi:nicotinamide mononucleotide adenylyltransferase